MLHFPSYVIQLYEHIYTHDKTKIATDDGGISSIYSEEELRTT